METFIDARSPLFRYSPCKQCNDTSGFTLDHSTVGESSVGFTTKSTEPVRVAFNFTGTSASFHLSRPSISSYQTRILINGTGTTSSASDELVTADSSPSFSVRNLPRGRHALELVISRVPSVEVADDFVRVQGLSLGMPAILSAMTKNETVDDTAWASGDVILTDGWNMLEKNQSNWINATEISEEREWIKSNYNSSVSWTTMANASTTIRFTGGTVWAMGQVGPDHGLYQVTLDGQLQGAYNASAASRAYEQVLFYTTGLDDASHNLTLTNEEQGKRLSFDRLIATTGAVNVFNIATQSVAASHLASATVTTFTASASASTASKPVVPRSTIIGVSVAIAVLATAILAWAIVFYAGLRERRNRKERNDGRRDDSADSKDKEKTNVLRFSMNSKMQPTFQMLSETSMPVGLHNHNDSDPAPHLARLAAQPGAVEPLASVQFKGKAISQPAMSPALEAALGGQTHSPLTQLKLAKHSSNKQTTPVKLVDRKLETPFLSLNGRGGDATSERVEFGATTLEASVIPEMDEPSSRRRFFGRAIDGEKRGSGSSYGSAKTRNSVGSYWKYM